MRLTLGWRQADVGLEELAAAGGILDAVGQRLANLPDAQVEQLCHRECAHHHLGGRPGHAQPCRLGGAPPTSPFLPRPPVGRACCVRRDLPTCVRTSVRLHAQRRGWWGGCLSAGGALVTSPRRRLDVRTLGMQICGGSEASEGGAVKRPLVGAWPVSYSRRTDVTASCVISRTESASLPIGGACSVPIKSNKSRGRLRPRLARSPGSEASQRGVIQLCRCFTHSLKLEE